MKYSFNHNNWIWNKLGKQDLDQFLEVIGARPKAREWLQQEDKDSTNKLFMYTADEGDEYIFGSLVYQQDLDSREDRKIFQFYLEKNMLVTANFEFDSIKASHSEEITQRFDKVDNAIEGFFILIGEILSSYLLHIDEFEDRLEDLIWVLKTQNKVQTLEKVADNRHELLIWKNLMIPLIEIKIAAEEAFGEWITEKKEYKRIGKRIERGTTLIREHQYEIDTMLKLEEVVSSHRGNEIMKTLTVMTILFTPIAAWGALWGMNFEIMPELKWKFGYAASIGVIVLTTAALYFYLWLKGWTGDVLQTKKKDSFFQ
jgi:magnesium transporter